MSDSYNALTVVLKDDSIQTPCSADAKGCEGCQYQGNEHGWCYMFEDSPIRVPCAQHDKFEKEREANRIMISKDSEWLRFLINLDDNGFL